MANEISASVGLQATKTNLKVLKQSETIRVDMAGSHTAGGVQSIGTSYELLAMSADVGTLGWGYFRNLDVTNYVEVGLEVSAAFYPFLKLKPGEFALMPLGAAYNAIFAKANTGAVNLEFLIIER